MVLSKSWAMVKHFTGAPKLADFKLIEKELPPLKDGGSPRYPMFHFTTNGISNALQCNPRGRFSMPECVLQRSPPLINMGLTLQRFHYPTPLPERIPLDNRGLR
ncbi:hypothetical protein FKM82_021179, partial [Ascaphus truei]